MYARIMTVEMGPGMREEGIALAERWAAAVATLPGFVNVTFFGDEDVGTYGYFSVWETREAAEDARDAAGPQAWEALLEHALKRPVVRIYEVYQSKALR
jgi:heme-degrading monooxygenase HmoA